MSRRCQISGKQTASGNSISHSHRKTRRKFRVNLVSKKVFLPDENRWVRLRISARMLRTLNKRGVKSLMKQYGQDLSQLSA
ncbi:MAG: 50S ribosomal protein L28 [Spirochaetales bacterium]|nr:50S ribosomal protein L28 [Leptospiraceae bacterium]MCP5479920.1 50S ribosomal protein L28 [Spirochaetales bacterium]MCP5486645.1 50S ribosomal protein L28 [Spirochaetales bacterium]